MSILTKKLIDALPLPPKGRIEIHWDGKIAGLGLRVFSNGTKKFIYNYRTKQGRSRQYTIGLYGAFTLDQARNEAYALCQFLPGPNIVNLTSVFGTPDAIATVEQSSAHYFQRPDLASDIRSRRIGAANHAWTG